MKKKVLCTSIFLLISFSCLFLSKTYCQTELGMLKGFVTDKKTDQKLANASIVILSTDKGTISNLKGYFELQLPPGEYIAEARMLGYIPLRKQCQILPGEKTSLFFDLEASSISTDEVSVTGKKYDNRIKSRSIELLPGDLKNIPQFGEADPFRVMQALPGITAINDFANQLYLRGGNFDETLISLDDVPLYNPYHLGGIFSSINSDIISKEKIYLSNYPQSLGGYLSGVLELSSKTGLRDTFRTSASLGLLSSRGFIEGPLWKGTFIAAARRTYLDAVNLFYDKAEFPYYFYDVYTKYTLPVDDKNIVYISGFYSSDVLKEELKAKNSNEFVTPKWGNLLLNSRWTHLTGESSDFSLQLYLSRAFLNSDEMEDGSYYDNLIHDLTLKAEYDIRKNNNWLQFGFEYKYLMLDYSWFDNYSRLRDYINPPEEVFFDYAPNPYAYKNSSDILSSYITAQFSLTERTTLKAALRGCYIGNISSFIPCASVGLEYNILSNISLGLNYGRYYQFLYTLKERRPESLYSPFSVYFLPDNKETVANSDHFAADVDIADFLWGMDLSIEGYYKLRNNLASAYTDHPRLRFEKGYAAGIDFLMKKESGILTGWIGYSFGKSVKRNDSYSYYSNYDRRHTVKILMGYQLSGKWKLNAFWTYATGTPYTDIAGLYLGGMDFRSSTPSYYSYSRSYESLSWRLIDGSKNTLRLDDHHRLDLGIIGSFIWGSFLVHPYLQILNVYSSSNQIILNNNILDHGEDSQKFQSSFIIPTLGVNIEF